MKITIQSHYNAIDSVSHEYLETYREGTESKTPTNPTGRKLLDRADQMMKELPASAKLEITVEI
jgi:hypothetical protein